MGCATSKEVARKRAERESWYAPVSRSISAPIHYPAQNDADSCHVVSLASSSYGIMELERPGDPLYKGSFVRILHDKHIIHEEKRIPAGFASYKLHGKCDKVLKPVEEVPEMEIDGMETINTWELMEGLDDDAIKTPSPLTSVGRTRCFERAMSFDTALDFDSSFSDIGTPVLKKYYLHEEEGPAKDSIPSAHTKLGVAHRSCLSFGGAEDELCGDYSEVYDTRSSMNAQPKSTAVKSRAGAGSPSPCRSPMGSSPIKSPLMASNNSSPLFDPSLMATFEQALQAIALPEEEWTLLHDPNDDSLTNSSASSGTNTWIPSETSSDAESPPPLESSVHQDGAARKPSATLLKASQTEVMEMMSLHNCNLDSFELSCPPRGEGKVVLYFTSLRGVRKTFEDCCELRLILQGFGVHLDERDVWMHSKFRDELSELMKSKRLQVPRLFIKGRYIGGADEVKRLHEDGILAGLMEGLPSLGMFHKVCQGCADVRFVPCLTCSGSCKILDALNQTVRCSKCNENGLIMCPLCS